MSENGNLPNGGDRKSIGGSESYEEAFEKIRQEIKMLYARYRKGEMCEAEYFNHLRRLDEALQKLEKRLR